MIDVRVGIISIKVHEVLLIVAALDRSKILVLVAISGILFLFLVKEVLIVGIRVIEVDLIFKLERIGIFFVLLICSIGRLILGWSSLFSLSLDRSLV